MRLFLASLLLLSTATPAAWAGLPNADSASESTRGADLDRWGFNYSDEKRKAEAMANEILKDLGGVAGTEGEQTTEFSSEAADKNQ